MTSTNWIPDYEHVGRALKPRRRTIVRPSFLRDGVCVVPLTKGYEAICDADLLRLVGAFNWHASIQSAALVPYAMRSAWIHGRYVNVPLHRFVLDLTPDDNTSVDHINGDTLDNRRGNLRQCTVTENNRNVRMQRANRSGYKGVVKDSTNRWKAQIKTRGRTIYLGSFTTPEAAALAYNDAARSAFGEFARLNVIPDA